MVKPEETGLDLGDGFIYPMGLWIETDAVDRVGGIVGYV
jgi:hypothetical protein